MVNRRLFLIVFILCLALSPGWSPRQDRHPAVAGQLYPADPKELKATLQTLFHKGVPSKHLGAIAAIIAPHAGYVYSGEVAASAFNQIDPSKNYNNVFILGSSHHVAFEGASIYTGGNFLTPLGTVRVNTELAGQLVGKYSFFSDRADAHEGEHSIEVQLPFLQERLRKKFSIVPIVLGTRSPDMCKKIADALHPYFTPENLFIISTDFSHYPRYEDAVAVDKATADAVCSKSSEKFLSVLQENAGKNVPNLATSMCGWTSVLTLLYMMEKNPSVALHQIQYKNSGDTGHGDKGRVVGYDAIAVSVTETVTPATFSLRSRDKKELLAIARSAVEQYLKKSRVPEVDTTRLSGNLKTACGAFVTLRKHGELRGCIGRFEPDEPLYRVVQSMAVAASTEDHRFLPVTAGELDAIEIEISVLTPLRRVSSIEEIKLGKHGIYVKKGNRTGTFLPQVAAETGWSREEFVGHCAQDKAGIGWDGWKDAELFVYEAIVFSEHDSGK